MHDSTAMENRARMQQRLLLVVDAKICKTGKRALLGTRQALRNSVLSSFFVLLEPGCAGILILALLAKHKVVLQPSRDLILGCPKQCAILTKAARTFGSFKFYGLAGPHVCCPSLVAALLVRILMPSTYTDPDTS